METFSALLAICAGNSPVSGEFPAQSPVTRSFDVFFDLRLNKRLSKQPWGWWFETLSWSLWRHRNATCNIRYETVQTHDNAHNNSNIFCHRRFGNTSFYRFHGVKIAPLDANRPRIITLNVWNAPEHCFEIFVFSLFDSALSVEPYMHFSTWQRPIPWHLKWKESHRWV